MENTCARAVVAPISRQSVMRKPMRGLVSTQATSAAAPDGGDKAASNTAARVQANGAIAHNFPQATMQNAWAARPSAGSWPRPVHAEAHSTTRVP
eukprot:6914275-Lingulodinium_polyedra.AAC.1